MSNIKIQRCEPSAAKTNIVFGDAPRIYSTNSRSSFTPLSRRCPSRISPILQSSKSQIRLGDAAAEFCTDSIASSHHRSLSGSASTSTLWSPDKSAAAAAKLSKEKLLESHLPWKEPPLYTTTSRAMPPNFIHRPIQEVHIRQETVKSGIKFGDYAPTYTTSSNTATSFTEAKAEFGAHNFFRRGSRRHRGAEATTSMTSNEIAETSKSLSKIAANNNRTGFVLGYDSTEYQCTNSMSRYFDRSKWDSSVSHKSQSRPRDANKTNINSVWASLKAHLSLRVMGAVE